MLDFSFFDYLKFMHSPQLFDLIHFHSLLKACYQRFWKCKKPVVTDWLFPCREEYRIIEPDLGGVRTN